MCTGGSTLPRPVEGYWSDRSSPGLAHHIYRCTRGTCKGASHSSTWDACWTRGAFHNSTCNEDKILCTTGASGPLCGVCDEGYTFSSSQKVCINCESAKSILTLEFVVCVLILVAILVLLIVTKRHPHLWSRFVVLFDKGKGKVLWSNLQIVSSVSWTMEVVYPQPFATLLRIYEITELNPLGSLSLACANATLGSFKTYALSVSLLPIGLIFLIWFVYLARVDMELRRSNRIDGQEIDTTSGAGVELATVSRKKSRSHDNILSFADEDKDSTVLTDEEKQHKPEGDEHESTSDNEDQYHSRVQSIFNEHMQAILILVYLVYPTVSAVHFRSFACTDFEDGSSFLRADTSVDCNSQSYQGFFVAILLLLIAYQALPIILFTLLYRVRQQLNPPDISDPEAAFIHREQLRYDPAIAPYYFLFGDCYCSCYWWEVVDMYRRMFFTGLVSQFGQGQIRTAVGTGLSLVVVTIFREALPYHSTLVNRLSVVAQYQVFAAFVGSFILWSDFPMKQGTLGITLIAAYIAFLPLSWEVAMTSVALNARDESKLFCGRFEILDDPHRFVGQTVIVNAKDIFNEDRLVTIKFMANEEAFRRETRPRPNGFLPVIISSEHPKLHDRWIPDLHLVFGSRAKTRQSFGQVKQHSLGIVQPVAETLDVVLLKGLHFGRLVHMLLDCARALGEFHSSSGYIHGSFQVLSIVREGKDNSWKVVNIEKSVAIGNLPGSEISGTSPPELAKAVETHNTSVDGVLFTAGASAIIVKPGSSKYGQAVIVRNPGSHGLVQVETEGNEIKSYKPEHLQLSASTESLSEEAADPRLAHPTHDVWAFGLIFFHVFVKRPIFQTNHDGRMASEAEETRLAQWSLESLRPLIWCVSCSL